MAQAQVARDALQGAEGTPIAQLQPEIANPATRLVEGEVTITWPFSIVTKSIAFKLVESDFRLRMNKGQVRVDFHGAAGKAVAKAAVGGGDRIQLCLEGVEFERSSAPARPDTLEWQLEFTNRLRLKICRAENQEEEYISVDASDTDQEEETPATIPEPAIEPSTPEPILVETLPLPKTAGPEFPSKRLASTAFDGDEFASPAFVKRAKVSYGSLFEGGLDFLDDETKRLGRKKRSRFSMHANWRYNSRTPSPEPEHHSELDEGSPDEEPVADQSPAVHIEPETSPRPSMIDEGCQTQVGDASPSIPTQPAPAFGVGIQASPSPFQPSRVPGSDEHLGFMSMPISNGHDAASGLSFSAQGAPQPFGTVASESRGLFSQPPSSSDMPHPEIGHPLQSQSQRATPGGMHGEFAGTAEPKSTEVPPGETNDHHLFNAPLNFDIPTQLHEEDHEEPTMVEEYPHDILSHPPSFAPSQLEQSSWSALTSAVPQEPIHDSNDTDNPVEIIDSSSPPRVPSPSFDQHDTREFEDQQPEISESERDEPDGPQETDYMEPETDELGGDPDSPRSSVEMVEEPNEDGGDLAGEDYDLRNYDRTQDDDVVESDDESEEHIDPSDPDQQIVNLQEESDESESEMEEEWDSNDPRVRKPMERGYSDEEDDVDADGEEYDEEYDEEGPRYPNLHGDDWNEEDEEEGDYDGEEEEEEEEEEGEPVTRPTQSQDPVFISLLSDSEDGDEEEEKEQDTTRTLAAKTEQDKEALDEKQELHSHQAAVEPASSPVHGAGGARSGAEVEKPEEAARPEEHAEAPQAPEVSMDEAPEKADQMAIDEDHTKAVEEEEITNHPKATRDDEAEDALPETSQPEGKDTAVADEHVAAAVQPVPADKPGDEDGMDLVMTEVETGEQPAAADDDLTAHEAKHVFSSSITSEVDPELASRVKESISQIAIEELEDASPSEQQSEAVVESVVEVVEATEATEPPPGSPAQESLGRQPETIQAETMAESRGTMPSADKEEAPLPVEEEPQATREQANKPKDIDAWSPPLTRSHDETHDTSMQEASRAAETWSPPLTRSHDGATGAPTKKSSQATVPRSPPLTRSHDDVHEKHVEEASEAIETWSPPLTRSHDPTHPALTEDESKKAATIGQSAQLPTPGETQRDEDAVMHDEEDEPTDAELSFAAEQQIMTESQAHEASPETSSSNTTTRRLTRSKAKPKRQRDILITADSLRSADHRKSGSSIATDEEHSVVTDAVEEKQDEEQPAPTPRITRSKADDNEPSESPSKMARTRKRNARQDATPEPALETPRTTRQLRSRSKTPEPTASALEEPSVAGSAVDSEEAAALKSKLIKGLRTELPDFLPLKALRNSLHKTADFIGVSTMTPGKPFRPQGGPRDYILELILTDAASAPSSVTVVSIIRHFKDSLPSVKAGDVVLLRHFEVLSMKGRGFGLRVCDESAWAVFEKDDEEMLPQIKGAPVEVSDQEFAYAEDLRRWWSLVDSKATEKIEKATQKALQAPKEAMKAEKASS